MGNSRGLNYRQDVQIGRTVARLPEQRGTIQSDLIIAVGTNVSAQMVLADFREAMRVAVGTGFFCYRAIEAMMQSMRGADITSDNSAWQQLRDRLRIDRSAIDEIKSHADLGISGHRQQRNCNCHYEDANFQFLPI